jgi:DNA polymerase-3 subunit beta
LTLPVEDYPALPDMPEVAGTISGPDFAAAVASVAVAAGRDDTLPVLTGIRMEIEGDRLTLAATDRYRLAVRELVWHPDSPTTAAVALIQAKSLADTARALADSEQIHLALATGGAGEGIIGFEGAVDDRRRRATTRLLDGEFPKYRSLLPTESAATATVEEAVLAEAVKRMALVAERNTPVRMTFSDGEVLLEAGTGDEAQATELVACQFDGEPLTIAFNPTFLLDGLAALGAPFAEFSFTASTKPAVLAGRSDADSAADDTYRYLLMPVRLSG